MVASEIWKIKSESETQYGYIFLRGLGYGPLFGNLSPNNRRGDLWLRWEGLLGFSCGKRKPFGTRGPSNKDHRLHHLLPFWLLGKQLEVTSWFSCRTNKKTISSQHISWFRRKATSMSISLLISSSEGLKIRTDSLSSTPYLFCNHFFDSSAALASLLSRMEDSRYCNNIEYRARSTGEGLCPICQPSFSHKWNTSHAFAKPHI